MATQIPDIKEKIGMATSYLSLGIIGFIWLLVSKRHYYDQKDFIRFHCFQSIFIGLLFSFFPDAIGIIFSLISQILGFIPFLLPVVALLAKIHGTLQMVIKFGSLAMIVYCVIFCLYGKYTNIPYISQIINRMLR
jgi:uncharacterized membrane protein